MLAKTGPYAPTKGEVMEPAIFVFGATLPKTVRVKNVHILEYRGGVMGVPDAVHDTPAFGDLKAL